MSTYEIRGSTGDLAEAIGIDAARVAAETLVRDGNARADVWLIGRPSSMGNVHVGHAERAERGDDAVCFRTTQGLLKALS